MAAKGKRWISSKRGERVNQEGSTIWTCFMGVNDLGGAAGAAELEGNTWKALADKQNQRENNKPFGSSEIP
jgi:hypothetical protein